MLEIVHFSPKLVQRNVSKDVHKVIIELLHIFTISKHKFLRLLLIFHCYDLIIHKLKFLLQTLNL
jgi:hypothetical protein